jgi:hypothetical protein
MRKTVVVIIAVAAMLSGLLTALGFNTIEWMTQKNQEATWYFIYPMKFGMPFWWAYFLGGIMPLWGGGVLTGIIVGLVISVLWRKRKTPSG